MQQCSSGRQIHDWTLLFATLIHPCHRPHKRCYRLPPSASICTQSAIMLTRPSPGRLRALLRAVGQARSRPRLNNATIPLQPRSFHSIHLTSVHLGHASRILTTRSIHSSTASARNLRRTTSLAALLKRIFPQAARVVRLTLAKHTQPHHVLLSNIFCALRSTQLSAAYRVRSPLLKGAIDAFRSTVQRTSTHSARTAYSQLNTASVSFARGTLSGIGTRPAAGRLALSPLRGGVGLQSARKFSSGGARVFDNLIVHAPLAMRLAGDEVQDKLRLAGRQPVRARTIASAFKSPGPRRTGAMFSSEKLAGNAFLFAANKGKTVQEVDVTSCESTTLSDSESQCELDLYFQFPQLELACTSTRTTVTLRLIDPLYVALGGREPSPPMSTNPRLFDSAFLVDANTALEYEHRRYVRAKAVLRVLWNADLVEDMDLDGDPAVWTVKARGAAGMVEQTLREHVQFEFQDWCTFVDDAHERDQWDQWDQWNVEADDESASSSQFDLESTSSLSSVRVPTCELLDEVISLPCVSSASTLYDSRCEL